MVPRWVGCGGTRSFHMKKTPCWVRLTAAGTELLRFYPRLLPTLAGLVLVCSLLATYMSPLCTCVHNHRIPVESKELERVWSIMDSCTFIRKGIQQLRSPELGEPAADILFWNRKLQVERAASIQKLKADLSSRVKKVSYYSYNSNYISLLVVFCLSCRMANRYTQRVRFKIS